MPRLRVETAVSVEREVFRIALWLVVVVAAVVAVLPRLVDIAATASP